MSTPNNTPSPARPDTDRPEQNTADERYCLQALADLRRSYELAAQPYIKRLVQIRSLRPAPLITLTLDQAREFIDFTMGSNGS